SLMTRVARASSESKEPSLTCKKEETERRIVTSMLIAGPISSPSPWFPGCRQLAWKGWDRGRGNPAVRLLRRVRFYERRGWHPLRPSQHSSQTEENEMEQSVEKIIERNLLEVFNGRDADSRRAAIDELWDKDGVFIDPGGVHEGVEKINAIVELPKR